VFYLHKSLLFDLWLSIPACLWGATQVFSYLLSDVFM
jgi:hypothetical protein